MVDAMSSSTVGPRPALTNEIAASVLDLIGNTPLVRLSRIAAGGARGGSAEVLGKMESLNPGGSVKDRIALAMIEAAELHERRVADEVEHRLGDVGVG